MVKIYSLKDPRTGVVRYVGKTIKSLNARLSGHIYKAKNNKTSYVHCWIFSLLKVGYKPIIELIEEVDDSIWEEREKYWINYFPNLTNITEGGECGSLGNKMNSATINKIAQKMVEAYASNQRRPPAEKPVYQYELYTGKFLKKYRNCVDASVNVGVCSNTIAKSARLETRSSGGFGWSYIKYDNHIVEFGRCKRVLKIDKEGNILSEYRSAIDAAKCNNLFKETISTICTKLNNTRMDYTFIYKSDYNTDLLSKKLKLFSKKLRNIIIYDLNKNTKVMFNSIKEASQYLKMKEISVYRIKLKPTKKYKIEFKYE